MRQLFRALRQLLGLHDTVTGRACDEARMLEERPVEPDERLHARDLELHERTKHPAPCVLAIDVVHDELRHHRVVQRGDLGAGVHARVDAHARPCRRPVGRDPPRARQEAAGRILCVDPALDRVPAEVDVLLAQP